VVKFAIEDLIAALSNNGSGKLAIPLTDGSRNAIEGAFAASLAAAGGGAGGSGKPKLAPLSDAELLAFRRAHALRRHAWLVAPPFLGRAHTVFVDEAAGSLCVLGAGGTDDVPTTIADLALVRLDLATGAYTPAPATATTTAAVAGAVSPQMVPSLFLPEMVISSAAQLGTHPLIVRGGGGGGAGVDDKGESDKLFLLVQEWLMCFALHRQQLDPAVTLLWRRRAVPVDMLVARRPKDDLRRLRFYSLVQNAQGDVVVLPTGTGAIHTTHTQSCFPCRPVSLHIFFFFFFLSQVYDVHAACVLVSVFCLQADLALHFESFLTNARRTLTPHS
jgi:hypothetical protein